MHILHLKNLCTSFSHSLASCHTALVFVKALPSPPDRMCAIDPLQNEWVYLSAMCFRKAQQQVSNKTKQSDELGLTGIEWTQLVEWWWMTYWCLYFTHMKESTYNKTVRARFKKSGLRLLFTPWLGVFKNYLSQSTPFKHPINRICTNYMLVLTCPQSLVAAFTWVSVSFSCVSGFCPYFRTHIVSKWELKVLQKASVLFVAHSWLRVVACSCISQQLTMTAKLEIICSHLCVVLYHGWSI